MMNRDQETHHLLYMCNLCRNALFSWAPSHIYWCNKSIANLLIYIYVAFYQKPFKHFIIFCGSIWPNFFGNFFLTAYTHVYVCIYVCACICVCVFVSGHAATHKTYTHSNILTHNGLSNT